MYNKVKFNINDPQKIWFRNLQTARENKKWSQVKLAMEVGVSQQSITFYESGSRVPSLEVAVKLAKVLETTVDYLIGDEVLTNNYYSSIPENDDIISMVVEGKNNK